MDPLHAALTQHYGLKFFKDGQRPIVQAILDGNDVLALLPTGGGKSLCYQLPALVREGLVIVISPLVALMEDQVLHLHRLGIAAACIHAGIDSVQKRETIRSLKNGSLRLLYLSPERLRSDIYREILNDQANQKKIVALAVDEAHCISAWGHDFRPDYRKIGEIRSLCPGVPMVALSATAAPKVRADIIRHLSLRKPFIHVSSARRSNLLYSMRRRPKNPLPEVLKVLKSGRGASLIYVRSRRQVENWSDLLNRNGIPTTPYHAGFSAESRKKALAYFLDEPRPVLVATTAFGMGVDRPDVGLVLHLNLPSTPEGYLQESGRAGRDGLPANCIVLFSPGDRTRIGWAIKSSIVEDLNKSSSQDNQLLNEIAQKQLRRMEALAEGEMCFEQSLLLSVGEFAPPCGKCDRCRNKNPYKDWSMQATTLLKILNKQEGLDMHCLIDNVKSKEENIAGTWGWLARRLVQDELINESNDGFQRMYIAENGFQFLQRPWPLNYAA